METFQVKVRVFLQQSSLGASPEPDHVFDLEVENAQDGLELLKFQISSLCAVEAQDQVLYLGPSAFALRDDLDVEALFPVAAREGSLELTVLRKPDVSAWQSVCTRALLGSTAVVQPAFVIPGGSEHQICHACAQLCFPPGLCTPIMAGDTLKRFACGSVGLCEMGLGSYVFADRFPREEAKAAVEDTTATEAASPSPPPVPIVVLIQSLRTAAFQQQAAGFSRQTNESQMMSRRLQSGYETVKAYEDPSLQAKARLLIPLATLQDRAIAAGADPSSGPEFRDALFRELLAWFKREFFRWVNQPPCDHCGKGTSLVGGAAPTPEESSGWAGRVEVYKCNECQQQTRFPRYNHPGKLLDTRRGRCGEWANCFTLCCRALGFEARYVMDWTDHVWTEVYSPRAQRWMHADACENRSDHPMMYERGWNKKLSYVVAFARDHCMDVTRRYTWRLDDVLARRTDVPELVLAALVTGLSKHVQTLQGVTGQRSRDMARRARVEEMEMHENCTLGEARATVKPGEAVGRISGDATWKRARGEDGGRGGMPADEEGERLTCSVPSVETAKAAARQVRGMRLPPYAAGGAPCVLVCLTSVGDDDTVPGSAPSRYSPTAIMVNGLPLAAGSRGHNVLVLDPSTGTITDSVAFNTSVEGGEGKKGLQAFLEAVPTGHVLLATVIGSGHLGPPVMSDEAPGHKEAWLLAGRKGAESGEVEWAVQERCAAGKGPARAVFTVPINPAAVGEEGAGVEWVNWVGSTPLYQTLCPPSSDGDSQPVEALVTAAQARGGALARGVSWRAGVGVFAMGPGGLPLKAADQWITKWTGGGVGDKKAEAGFRAVVGGYMLEGKPPGEAASRALLRMGAAGVSPVWRQLRWGERAGRCHPDTCDFDGTEAALPYTAMTLGCESLVPGRLHELRVWASAAAVNGLQCVYHLPSATIAGPETVVIVGDAHLGRHDDPQMSSLVLEGGDAIVKVEVWAGNLIDRLVVHTRKGVRRQWGGSDGGVRHEMAAREGEEAAAFVGGFGGHLHNLGVVWLCPRSSPLSPPPPPTPAPPLAWGLYTPSAMKRAARVLAMHNSVEAAGTALEAAGKYVENCRKDPSSAKFRSIRCAAAFFRDKVGGAIGSGLLMSALGFEFKPEGAEGPCWELPLARADRPFLASVLEELRECVTLVKKLAPAVGVSAGGGGARTYL